MSFVNQMYAEMAIDQRNAASNRAANRAIDANDDRLNRMIEKRDALIKRTEDSLAYNISLRRSIEHFIWNSFIDVGEGSRFIPILDDKNLREKIGNAGITAMLATNSWTAAREAGKSFSLPRGKLFDDFYSRADYLILKSKHEKLQFKYKSDLDFISNNEEIKRKDELIKKLQLEVSSLTSKIKSIGAESEGSVKATKDIAKASNNTSGSGNVVFIDVKDKPQEYIDAEGKKKHGALVMSTGKDAPKKILPSNTKITGLVTNMFMATSQYQGETINSLKIRMEDGAEPPVLLSVTLGSFYAAKIVGLFNAADLRNPVTFNVNTVREGEKMGEGVSERDNAFPTLRDATNNRLVPIYAGGVKELPEAPEVLINGKKFRNLEFVNVLVGKTLAELYEKMDNLYLDT